MLSYTANTCNKFVRRYNQRSKSNCFDVGDSVLVLQPNSTTSRMFATWKGPAQIVEKTFTTVIW